MANKLLGPCPCGSKGGENAAHCERCKLIYTVLLMAEVRTAQKAYFKTRTKPNISAALRAELKIDKALDRLLAEDESLATSPQDA